MATRPHDDDKRSSNSDFSDQIILTDTAHLAITASFSGKGFVGISTGEHLLLSCYLSPSFTNAQYASLLDEMEEEYLQLPHVNLLVSGDFNLTDLRGKLLEKFSARLGLVCENVGKVPTFQSVTGESVIDFTLSHVTGG